MDILNDIDIFDADDSDGFTARAEIIPLVTKDDESFLLNEDSIPDDMPLLPLHGNVLFPGVVMPISVGRKSSLKLLRDAEKANERIIVVAQRNDKHAGRYYRGTVTAHVVFRKRATGTVLYEGDISGEEEFDATGDLTSAKRRMMPEACKDLAERIVDACISIW